MINIVDGEGVVGETPVLAPGESFDYVSGCELTTHQGAMQGHYSFSAEDGSSFEVAIPHFALELPDPVE
jgi:ApaG protein